MEHKHKLILIIGLTSLTLLTILLFTIFCCRKRGAENGSRYIDTDIESELDSEEEEEDEDGSDTSVNDAELIKFVGGEGLSVEEILDAPGEVIAKSSYGTLYRASLVNSNSVTLLRFLRPSCTLRNKDVMPIVEMLGCLRHPNLVPLNAFYRGPREEKLMVHPFYSLGSLANFITDGRGEDHRWEVIQKIARGIAGGVGYLHSASITHGNLKSKNVVLDENHHPYISDFGLHLLLNPTAAHHMLEASMSQGYKAPELIKIRDANKETDIYSLGVILLELVSPIHQDLHLPATAIHDPVYHPDILAGLTNEQRVATQHRLLHFVQLAMASCSPHPHLRPYIHQIIEKLHDIGK